MKNTAEKFWSKVLVGRGDECWPWKEGLWENGYGRFKINYESIRAHRFALEFCKGPPPFPGAMALHIPPCLDRRCCNPMHLKWGTHEENMKHRKERKLPAHNRLAREETKL